MAHETTGKPEAKDVTYSIKEVAARAGVTEHAVRKAHREGRLKRCNAVSQRALFSQDELDRFMASRERESRPVMRPRAALVRPAEQIQMARADAVTNLVGQSQEHTEHAWDQARLLVESHRKASGDLVEGLLRENQRLTARVEKLELHQDEAHLFIETRLKAQYDEVLARAEAERIREVGKEGLKIARVAAPALLARLFGGERMNQGAFRAFVDSLSDEQRDAIFDKLGDVLQPEQAASLMTLLSSWDAGAKKEGANDTDRPPAGDAAQEAAAG